MKILKNLPIVKTLDTDKPFGATIKNETETEEGTPVVAELLADPINNLYRLLELAKITPTDFFDGDSTQYQIVDALQNLPNVLNDIERVLTLNTTTWSVDIDFDIIPQKYFFFARASENYVSGINYSLQGINASPSYLLTSTGFNLGDELLVIIDSTVRVYNLSKDNSTGEVFTVMGKPLAFNDTNKMYYQDDNGRLISDSPTINDLQGIIKVSALDTTIIVNDIIVLKGHVLCFCYSKTTKQYSFYQFNLNDLSSAVKVTSKGQSLPIGNLLDYNPYIFTDGIDLYVSNTGNTTNINSSIRRINYIPLNEQILQISDIDIDNTFIKTTNVFIKNQILYTMINGVLETYNLIGSSKLVLGEYFNNLGQIFSFNGNVYFTSGEVAKKWF